MHMSQIVLIRSRMVFARLALVCLVPTLLKGCLVEDADHLYGFPMRKVDTYYEDVDELISDGLIPDKWYRTVYMGKQFLLLDSNGADNWNLTFGMCGTFYPIYLQEPHPDKATLTNVPVKVTACTLNLYTECSPAYDVYIRKCDEEVQYYLTASIAYGGYCFDEGLTLYDPKDWPAPNLDDVDIGQITVNTTIVHESTPQGPLIQHKATTHFWCTFNLNPTFVYTINWYIDGNYLTTTGPSNDSVELSLTEKTIMDPDRPGINVSPGFTIRCGVQVSVLAESLKTDEVPGEEFFAGVKIEKRTIHLPKGGIGEIVLKTTIPVGCEYLSKSRTPLSGQCELKLEMGKENIAACTGDIQSTKDCKNILSSLTEDETFQPAEIRFPIVTVDINYNDKNVFDIDLRFGSHTSALWHNYVLPSVRVIVEDPEAHQNKWCYSHIDPHMRTTKGSNYEQQQKAGVYMMYINKAYDIEVQQKTKPCNSNHAMCACGVAVRAGKDVFMINRCGSIHYIDFVHCGEGGILEVLEINSEKYRILTPIGTRIEIHLYGGYYEGTMNIDIYMAPKDLNNIEGLCGTFNNDVNNEFLGSNGQQLPNKNDFAESWRMDSDTQNSVLKEKNLFINPARSLQSWKERNHLYCFCKDGNATCSSTQYYTCNFSNNITPLKCHVSKGYRRKRGTDSHMKELRRLFDLMNSVDPPTHYLYKRQAEAQNITAEDAYEACTALINGSLAVQSYSDLSALENPQEVINNCAYDVEVGGTLVWANAHVESYNDVVKNMIDLQPEYAANNTERIDVFLANTCPSNCTGNGNCTLVDTSQEGVCVCDTFYHGADCSIDERDPLIIDDIETGGECDTAERSDDCQCFAIRSGAILRSIQCTVKTFKISIDGTEEQVSEYRSNGSYEDIFTGACCSDRNKYDVDAFAVKYEVSASNDGSNYGNTKTVFVFDSTCQNVAFDENTNGTVVLNATSGCFIDNTCHFNGEVSQFNSCLGCNASASATGWSEAPCTTTTVSTTTATNPTTTVGSTTTTAEPTMTTAEPTTTIAEPTTTIAEPTTTTVEPTTTTVEPTTTTVEPTTTTVEPTTTTAEPTTTTAEPTTTTVKPTTTTEEPPTTTAEPTTTTIEPTTTDVEPSTTTAEPTTTTAEPTTNTAEPTTTTVEPTTTTVEPTTKTAEPTTNTAEPTTTTVEPTTTTVGPTTTTVEPTTTTAEPTITTVEPSTRTVGPTTTTAEPTKTIAEPTTTTLEPRTTIAEPTTSTTDPTTTTTKPTTTTVEPTTTTTKPTTTTVEPTTNIAEPTTTITEPTTTIAEPTTTITEPTTTTAVSTTTTAELTTTSEDTATTAAELMTTTEQYTKITTETTITTAEPSSTIAKRTITNPEPTTIITNPDTTNSEPTTTAVQYSTTNAGTSTTTTEPSITKDISTLAKASTSSETTQTTEGNTTSEQPKEDSTIGTHGQQDKNLNSFIAVAAGVPSAIIFALVVLIAIAVYLTKRRVQLKRSKDKSCSNSTYDQYPSFERINWIPRAKIYTPSSFRKASFNGEPSYNGYYNS